MQKFDEMAAGLSIGIISAFSLFLLGLTAGLFDWGTELVNFLGTFYRGYGPDLAGASVGALWGFIDGFIGGMLVAWLYNVLAKKKK